jgi:SAM-dependent methyltransferase
MLSRPLFALKASAGQAANRVLRKFGLRVIRLASDPQYDDVGRSYADPPGTIPNFRLKPGTPKPFAEAPTLFIIDNGSATLEVEVFYSHLTLLKLLKHFEFESVLDIGSHEGHVTRIFRHLGKKVTTVEVAPGFEADYKGDYLDIDFGEQFDAIWCSHTLEHQRNTGRFLDKMFDDLRDGGVLAVTVPYDLSLNLTFGHCNCFSPLILLYDLVLAGFDCSRASLKCYNYNIGLIVRKRYNGIKRGMSFAQQPYTSEKDERVELYGEQVSLRDIVGDEISDDLAAAFPFPISGSHLNWENVSVNWGDPI